MKVELVTYTPNPEEIIEQAGRTCYKSPEKDAQHRASFIKGIVKAGHTAVIEHASATFRISEVSRALTHQLVRHRHFSFCQQSQRYVKEDEPKFVTPPALISPTKFGTEALTEENAKIANEIYKNFMNTAWLTYRNLAALGLKKEDARYVLPNAAYTEIVVTGNFREWHQFLELRCDIHAQWEIRYLAFCILDELYKIAPSVFDDLYSMYNEQEKEENAINRAATLANEMAKPLSAAEIQKIQNNIRDNTSKVISGTINDSNIVH